MFVGRKKELNKLERLYSSNRFEFAVIYGRRRVGKTTLIREFCKNKKAIYTVGREANTRTNLENISRDIFHITMPDAENNSTFSSWEGVFDYIGKNAANTLLHSWLLVL